ncbi:MAG: metallophosphoesterase [Euryarchaeota archaeon]
MIGIATADFHGDVEKAEKVAEKAADEDADVIFVAGDVSDFNLDDPAHVAEEIVDVLEEHGQEIMAVPGNCDTHEVVRVLDTRGVSVHLKRKRLEDYDVVGMGGSNPTPFDTPLEFEERVLESRLRELMDRASEPIILLTHAPPKDTKVDRVESGEHVGSEAVRRIVEEYRPELHICAHIHEAAGEDELGDTRVVNPGPGGAVVLEL